MQVLRAIHNLVSVKRISEKCHRKYGGSNPQHILAKLTARSGQMKFNRVDKNYFTTTINVTIMIHVLYTHTKSRLYLVHNFH